MRDAELPLFLSLGVEIVPEEPNPVIIGPPDASEYEDEFAPVNAAWRSRCTLSPTILNIVRRSRLGQRNGRVSAEEEIAFNSSFDVLYAVCDLQTLINIRSWFKGDVAFRYLGHYSNMFNLEHALSYKGGGFSLNAIFAPMYSSLATETTARVFPLQCTISPYVAPANCPNPWAGFRHGQSAVVVLSSVYPGWQNERDLRSLAPLSRRVPLLVLGKNELSQVSRDLRADFDIRGALSKEVYLNEISNARLVVYPQSSSSHMHYVPIEVVSSATPLICRESIPLVQDFINNGQLRSDTLIRGVSRTHDELLSLAATVFESEASLNDVVLTQTPLATRFSSERTLSDITNLLSMVKRREIIKSAPSLGSLISSIPTTAYFEAQRSIVECPVSIPATDLVADLGSHQIIGSHGTSRLMLGVAVPSEGLRLALGEKTAGFPPGINHDIRLRVRMKQGGVAMHAELWSDGAVIRRAFAVKLEDGTRPSEHRVAFSCATPSLLIILLTSIGSKAELLSVSHVQSEDPVDFEVSSSGALLLDGSDDNLWTEQGIVPALLSDIFAARELTADSQNVMLEIPRWDRPLIMNLRTGLKACVSGATLTIHVVAAAEATLRLEVVLPYKFDTESGSQELPVSPDKSLYNVKLRCDPPALDITISVGVVTDVRCSLLRISMSEAT